MTSTSSERTLPVARHAGERIHALIWTRRMKQGAVAQAVGIGASTFSKKLRGEVPITVDELMTIAGVLGVDPGELLPRLDSNQQPSGYVSLEASNVTRLRPRSLPSGKSPPRQNLGNNVATVGGQGSNSGGQVIQWGARRGNGGQSARVE